MNKITRVVIFEFKNLVIFNYRRNFLVYFKTNQPANLYYLKRLSVLFRKYCRHNVLMTRIRVKANVKKGSSFIKSRSRRSIRCFIDLYRVNCTTRSSASRFPVEVLLSVGLLPTLPYRPWLVPNVLCRFVHHYDIYPYRVLS